MADFFWVGDGGDWSDFGTHWATTSGGGGFHGNVPTNADDVYFDANSFTVGSQTVVMDAGVDGLCKDFIWTGVTNTPNLNASAERVHIYGDVVLNSAMTFTGTNNNGLRFFTNAINLTTNGVTIGCPILLTSATVTQLDNLDTARALVISGGVWNTGNFSITTGAKNFSLTAGTVNLGSSLITTADWLASGGTLNAGTSTIVVTTTGNFNGNNFTYYNVELNSTSHTITGSNTFHILSLNPSGTQTITFTDSTVQTVTELERTGSGAITFAGSGAGGWTLTKTSHRRTGLEDMSISYSTAIPRRVWYAPSGIDGGNNVDWLFENLPLDLAQLRR